ncbi:MAG: acyl-CoA dehydrogenase [Chloroflexi bacterium]|nr:MAG: acyl-CoA dehydrogenase [Anaerolineaceae bacterium 4572_32.2]RLC84078.1 MAG: acyl-CoA dehydrogenase [Chloroflexota bacterium]HEY72738.1 acyl-CoA dehydrogenase [Thermoflexia bacterium]
MINFETPSVIERSMVMMKMMAEGMIRPISRQYDENEHEKPWDYINMVWETQKPMNKKNLDRQLGRGKPTEEKPKEKKEKRPPIGYMLLAHVVEMMSWGDAAIYLCTPDAGLGGTAIEAVGTPEQKERFLTRFTEGEPKWGAMAITEPGAGSDTAAIQCTATLDPETNEWILNGEKIFVTSGLMAAQESDGFVVVWATVDRSAGRAGIKSFVVDAGTPGMSVTKVEEKLGIRASDTASIVFDDCRIPYDNILGSPEVQDRKKTKGFKGAMQTFNASRPIVASSAIGVGRAAFEFVKTELEKNGVEFPYGAPRHKLTAVQRDVMDMEAQLKAAWLLVLRAVWMADMKMNNPVEASMCKAKAGEAVTWVTQKAVELMGPLGYSRKLLLEKWMRDAKINDIFEGTGQINKLIVARRILGFRSAQLK